MGHEQPHLSYSDMYTNAPTHSRDIVPLSRGHPPEAPPPNAENDDQPVAKSGVPVSLFSALSEGRSLRKISPRNMARFSLDLYANGLVTFEDYEMLAFQPELHPDYNATIGALTGQKARPNRPRDFIAHWEDRLSFVQRYNPQSTELVKRTEKLVALLHKIESPSAA